MMNSKSCQSLRGNKLTKKKRELIEILLDNITPDYWPEGFPFAAQDSNNPNVYFYSHKPKANSFGRLVATGYCKKTNIITEQCDGWSKTIVTRDEFVKRWNERNAPGEAKTPQQLALEKFGTDWHENDGVQPVSDEVLIDAIVDGVIDHGVKMERYTWNTLGLFEIKKWRIHSDQAALLREPTPPCSEEIPCRFVDEKSPLETQIGGDHYTKLAIQPMQYSMENGLDALQHTVIKYVTRFRDKAGIEDLEKAKHCIDMLIEHEKEQK